MHQRFIDAINANPDDRATQLIYADWLDQQGDPRAEAWRVLIEEGKRPVHSTYFTLPDDWDWMGSENSHEPKFDDRWPYHCHLPTEMMMEEWWKISFPTFYSAMDAAAIAWVRCHRDPEFLRESTTV